MLSKFQENVKNSNYAETKKIWKQLDAQSQELAISDTNYKTFNNIIKLGWSDIALEIINTVSPELRFNIITYANYFVFRNAVYFKSNEIVGCMLSHSSKDDRLKMARNCLSDFEYYNWNELILTYINDQLKEQISFLQYIGPIEFNEILSENFTVILLSILPNELSEHYINKFELTDLIPRINEFQLKQLEFSSLYNNCSNEPKSVESDNMVYEQFAQDQEDIALGIIITSNDSKYKKGQFPKNKEEYETFKAKNPTFAAFELPPAAASYSSTKVNTLYNSGETFSNKSNAICTATSSNHLHNTNRVNMMYSLATLAHPIFPNCSIHSSTIAKSFSSLANGNSEEVELNNKTINGTFETNNYNYLQSNCRSLNYSQVLNHNKFQLH